MGAKERGDRCLVGAWDSDLSFSNSHYQAEMAVRTVNLSTLKRLKNSIIGNPSAKLALAQDDAFVRTLIECLNHSPSVLDEPQGSKDDIRIEAAHIISSLSYGSEEALSSLLRADTLRACLFAINQFQPSDPSNLKAAIARALRSLAVAIADVVGPSQWGLRAEIHTIRNEAKAALEPLFQVDALDTYLPLLLDPATQFSIAQLLAFSVRLRAHRTAVTEWLPPSDRIKESKGKRGWEKPAMVNSNAPNRQGGWVARNLTALLHSKDIKLQEAASYGLAALVKDNEKVSIALARSQMDRSLPSPLTLVLSLTKSRSTDVQLAACLCATHIIRVNASGSAFTADDSNIRNIMNVLNRLIPSQTDTPPTRTKACFILYYLISDELNLCRFAHEKGALEQLAQVLKSITPLDGPKGWDEDEAENISALREAALYALAAMSLFADNVRREIADDLKLLPLIHACMSHRHTGIRHATCQCIRALSRSVAVLRTSLVDSGLGMAVFEVFKKEDEDRRVTAAALASVCNIVNDFSPLREVLFGQGLMPRLVQLLQTGAPNLCLNSLWAIKNLVRKTPTDMKRNIMTYLGWRELAVYLADPKPEIQEQAFNIVRNLSEDEAGIELVFSALDIDVLSNQLCSCFSSADPAMEDVIHQAICVLGNLLNVSDSYQKLIITHPSILRSLRACLGHTKPEIRRPAVSCLLELVRASPESRKEIIDAGIPASLKHICEWSAGVVGSPGGPRAVAMQNIKLENEAAEDAGLVLRILDVGAWVI
ncbi:hypothetical protein HGRIS_012601 [Hohenbuehelia grisea]|uniref:Armadillo repeat-containing protein 8 n=1 Tax=Hohenbuehelia grisea TaxID=104357 RepID=A0ABR3ISR7_9AGAR